jgi:hypothetical protein
MRRGARAPDPEAEGGMRPIRHGRRAGRIDGHPIGFAILTDLRVYSAHSRYFAQTLICNTDKQHWIGANDLIWVSRYTLPGHIESISTRAPWRTLDIPRAENCGRPCRGDQFISQSEFIPSRQISE